MNPIFLKQYAYFYKYSYASYMKLWCIISIICIPKKKERERAREMRREKEETRKTSAI